MPAHQLSVVINDHFSLVVNPRFAMTNNNFYYTNETINSFLGITSYTQTRYL